jgi:hypothetical protein
MEKSNKRECGNCTKCCEGWLSGQALGHKFYGGRPCHFISTGKGCTVYAQRPKDPCMVFKCEWLNNSNIPEWFKPNEINAIVKISQVNGIEYLSVIEAGIFLQSKVLSWLIQYALTNELNFAWQVEGEFNWLGSEEFNLAMLDLPKDKFLHSTPNLLPIVALEE